MTKRVISKLAAIIAVTALMCAALVAPCTVMVMADPTTSAAHITIDARIREGIVRPDICGINVAAWDSDFGSPKQISLLRQTSLHTFRYPGGSWADSFDWTKPRYPSMPMTKEYGAFVEALGGDGSIIVNYGSGTPQMAAAWAAYCVGSPSSTVELGVDWNGKDWKTAGFWASLRAGVPLKNDDGFNVLRANHPKPYPFHRFEIGNECYGSWETDTHPQKQDPVLYAQFYAEAYHLIKLAAPGVTVGAVVVDDDTSGGDQQESVRNPRTNAVQSGWTPVVFSTLNGLNVIPDFVIYHYYPEQPGHESDSYLLTESSHWAVAAQTLRTLLVDYFYGRASNTKISCTENNSVAFNPGKQTTSLVNGLYLADSFGAILMTEFDTWDWWCVHSGRISGNNVSASLYGWRNYGDYGVLSSPETPTEPIDTPYPTFYALELIAKFCAPGDIVVASTSDNSLSAVYAVKQKDRTLALLLINKSPTAVIDDQITLHGFHPAEIATLWSYGEAQDQLQSQGRPSTIVTQVIDSVSQTFSISLTPYSMAVVQLSPTKQR
jgi:hypothetical protein